MLHWHMLSSLGRYDVIGFEGVMLARSLGSDLDVWTEKWRGFATVAVLVNFYHTVVDGRLHSINLHRLSQCSG